MTDMTRAQLRTLTRDLALTYQSDVVPDALIDRFLIAAANDFCARVPWPFLRTDLTYTLAPGDTSVPLVSTKIVSVTADVAGTVRVLRAMTPADQRTGAGAGSSGPAGYRADPVAGLLRVFPAAGVPVQVTVTVQSVPGLLGSDAATAAPIPERFQEALAFKAAARLVAREGEDQVRQGWLESEYESYVTQAVSDLFASSNEDTVYLGGDAVLWEM